MKVRVAYTLELTSAQLDWLYEQARIRGLARTDKTKTQAVRDLLKYHGADVFFFHRDVKAVNKEVVAELEQKTSLDALKRSEKTSRCWYSSV